MKVGYWLARLGGAQEEVLRKAPGDVPKQTSLGAVLVGTASIAAISAAFALNTAVDLPVVPAVLVGLLWGLLILNLDRMLVVSMGRRNGVWANVATALPRLLLALLIGTVISIPLVLRIFQPEIDAELQVMRNEALDVAQTRLNEDQRFAVIPALEADEDQLRAVVAGQQRASVADDPEVRTLQEQFDAKEAEFRQAEQEIICENDGTCGTGVVGRGASYLEKRDRKNRLEAERNGLRGQLDAAKAAATDRVESASVQEKQAAAAELTRVQAQLDALRTERTFEEDRTRATEIQNDGLLARLEALDRLSEGRPMMWLAHWTLILLFVCIELLPVLVKMLASTGPKTVYERLLERREADALDTDQAWSDKQREIAAIRVGVRLQLERDRADAQVEAGKRVNATLVGKQQEISDRAIEVWGEVAKRRADDELARWYAQYSRASATDPAAPPSLPWPAASPASATAPPTGHQQTVNPATQTAASPVATTLPTSPIQATGQPPAPPTSGSGQAHQDNGRVQGSPAPPTIPPVGP